MRRIRSRRRLSPGPTYCTREGKKWGEAPRVQARVPVRYPFLREGARAVCAQRNRKLSVPVSVCFKKKTTNHTISAVTHPDRAINSLRHTALYAEMCRVRIYLVSRSGRPGCSNGLRTCFFLLERKGGGICLQQGLCWGEVKRGEAKL